MTQKYLIPKILFLALLLIALIFVQQIFFNQESSTGSSTESSVLLRMAMGNGTIANDGFKRCLKFVNGWLKHADPETGLIPRNLNQSKDIWNAQDAAADNYPFMVLTTALLDRPMFEGKMLDMLRTETKLTSRLGSMPDTYSFSKKTFQSEKVDLEAIIFGSSEYIKDGLLPLTEWLGVSPWSRRMINILDEMWKRAPIETPYDRIVSTSVEVNGEMLQTLSRVYWMTGEKKYLDWAIRLGDNYLLNTAHPTKNQKQLRLRDHGCEIVSGLCELYATLNFSMPEKKREYQESIHLMLDRILEVGRNEHGLFYNVINPITGEIINEGIADTWGYTFNGFYTVYLIDKTEKYRDATIKALKNIYPYYLDFDWENNSSDGYADAIESALNLFNREPVPETANWIDSQIRVMWNKQQDDGVIEGWHGDGNFARTTIMYCLWKTQGILVNPWREDVIFGAVSRNGKVYLNLKADLDWKGKIIFDQPRHKTNMKLPIDWPRINQFPEWFTVEVEKKYSFRDVRADQKSTHRGEEFISGIPVILQGGQEKQFIID
jgi:hypothetical protein